MSSHIDDVISLNPTDTAIKGSVRLSPNSIILIEKNEYNNLSIENKNKLSRFNVSIFEGNLKDAIDTYLISTKKYTSERLTLSSSKGGYEESKTSEELKKTINLLAKEKGISMAYHMNILLHNTEITDKLKAVENEHENILKIKDYYEKEFYKYLFSEMPVDEMLQYCLMNYSSETYIEQLCEVIKKFGLENYKRICDKFNYTLSLLKESNNLPTPQEIINSINKGNSIDLCDMIRNFNIKEYEEARKNYQNEEIYKIQAIQSMEFSENQKGRSV